MTNSNRRLNFTTLDNRSRPQSKLLKDNLIINQGSEVAIKPQYELESVNSDNKTENNSPSNVMSFLENIISSMIKKERKEAKFTA